MPEGPTESQSKAMDHIEIPVFPTDAEPANYKVIYRPRSLDITRPGPYACVGWTTRSDPYAYRRRGKMAAVEEKQWIRILLSEVSVLAGLDITCDECSCKWSDL